MVIEIGLTLACGPSPPRKLVVALGALLPRVVFVKELGLSAAAAVLIGAFMVGSRLVAAVIAILGGTA